MSLKYYACRLKTQMTAPDAVILMNGEDAVHSKPRTLFYNLEKYIRVNSLKVQDQRQE